MNQTSRTWIEIDLEVLRQNVRNMKAALPAGCKFLGVVKADAYAHGVIPCARAILEAGADYLAVACLSEALELRQNGIEAPVLILGITPAEDAEILRQNHITQAVSSLSYAEELSAQLTGTLKVHMKLETGMGRTGFAAGTCSGTDMQSIVKALSLPHLDYEGVFTHFAVSDSYGDPYTAGQYKGFTEAIEEAQKLSGHRFAIRHCVNSGAMVNYREYALDMVRPGLLTYGYFPEKGRTGGLDLHSPLALKTRIYGITHHAAGDTLSYGRTYKAEKDITVAILPIGYADGYKRSLSNQTEVLIHGKRVKQIGRICMDMCMVDITDLPECQVGDVVTLIGTDGNETITADELADKIGTISYEILSTLGKRIERVYLNE